MKALLFSLLFASPLTAATILIDFGTAQTSGQPQTWNNFTGTANGSSIPVLRDTTGVETPYALTLSGGSVSGNSLNPTNPTNTYNPFTPTTVIQDFLFIDDLRTFTLSGLTPGVLYDLTFFAYASDRTSRGTRFTIAGHTPLDLQPSNNVGGTPNPSGGQVGDILGVAPDSSGNIAIDVTSTVANNWILSGLAINYTIPEPSTALLSACGLIPLLLRRR